MSMMIDGFKPLVLRIVVGITLLMLIVGGITMAYMRYNRNRSNTEWRTEHLNRAFSGPETARLIASDEED